MKKEIVERIREFLEKPGERLKEEINSFLYALKLIRPLQANGLDIGERVLKLVRLTTTTSAPSLVNYATREIPAEEMSPSQRRSFITGALKEMAGSVGVKEVYATITGKVVTIKNFTVPLMPPEELPEAVRWEARNHFPFELEEAIMEFIDLGEVRTEEGIKRIEIMAFACREDAIDEYVSILREANLVPMGIGVNCLALKEVLRRTGGAREKEVAILDIGAAKTEISFFKGEKLQFARELTIAGDSFTEAMTETMVLDKEEVKLDFGKAQELKQKFVVPIGEEVDAEVKTLFSQAAVKIRPVLEKLVDGIAQTLDYYHTQFGVETLDKLFLAGGGSKLKNLDGFLAEQLGVEVEMLDPVRKIISYDPSILDEVRLKENSSILAVAIGQALARGQAVNLMPVKYRIEKIRALERISLRMVTLVVGLVLLLSYALMSLETTNYRRRVREAGGRWKSICSFVTEFEALKGKIEQRSRLFRQITSQAPPLDEVLRELSNILPPTVMLDQVLLEKGTRFLNLKGVIFPSDSTTEVVLSELMDELSDSPFFNRVELIVHKKSPRYGYRAADFELSCRLEMGGGSR